MNHLQNMHSLRDAANYALYTIASILGPLLRTYCPLQLWVARGGMGRW